MASKKATLQFVAIGLIAALTGISVYSYTSGVESRVKRSFETKALYIAIRQIPAGTTISSALNTGSIESRQFPVISSPSNALQEVTKVDSTLVARYTVQPGQILLNDTFGVTGNPTGALVIPNGMIAVTIQVNDAAKVASFVQPGSEIAIFASGQVTTSDSVSTQVLLPEVLVLAVGNQVLPSTNQVAGVSSSLVTLAVTPIQAKKLIHASQNFTLYFGLLGTSVKFDFTGPATNSSLFNQ